MGRQDLYISIHPDTYKENKTEILNTELALLNSLKHLEKIRQIRKDKFALKIQLKQQVGSVLEKIKDLKIQLPENWEKYTIYEKDKSKIKEISRERTAQNKESYKRLEEIEKELLEINAKIKKLNS